MIYKLNDDIAIVLDTHMHTYIHKLQYMSNSNVSSGLLLGLHCTGIGGGGGHMNAGVFQLIHRSRFQKGGTFNFI